MLPLLKDLFHGLLYDANRFRRWMRLLCTLAGAIASGLLATLPPDAWTKQTKLTFMVVAGVVTAIGVVLPMGEVKRGTPP